MANTALRVVQVGKETTWGTGVTATAKLMALLDASANYNQEIYQPDILGTLAPGQYVEVVATDWNASITVAATYEDLPYFFDGFFGTATPSGTGPYTYSYTGPTTSTPSPRIFTVEYGTSSGAYQLTGGLINGVTIDIAQGESWKVTADMIGKGVSSVTLASLSDRTVNLIGTGDTTVYIDSYGGTFGSTAVSATVISASIKLTNGRHLKRFIGDTAPGNWGEDKYNVEASMTLEFNSTSKAYVDALLSGAVSKAIRVKASSGSNSATLDMSGIIKDGVQLFGDRDGNITVDLTFSGRYDATNGMWCEAVVVNGVSALA